MQKGAAILTVATALLLGACDSRTRQQDAAAAARTVPAVGDVPVEKGLAINTPEFEGRLNIPGLSVGSDDMDLDGMELPPGSKVTGIKVDAPESGRDQVRIAFTSTAPAPAVADHFRAQAKAAGYALTDKPAAALDVRGAKPEGESFALKVEPAGAGATATLLLVDKD